MKIGIICAGDRELEPFLPHIKNRISSNKAMLTFMRVQLMAQVLSHYFAAYAKQTLLLQHKY